MKTDASAIGIEVVPIQEDHPISFTNKGLAPRHATFSVYDIELLPLIFFVIKWSHYLRVACHCEY